MKVGTISNNYPPETLGGAEIYAKALADEISKKQEEFAFAGRYNIWEYMPKYDLSVYKEDYWVYRLGLASMNLDYKAVNNFFDPVVGLVARNIFKKERPDVLHFHNLAGLSVAPLLATHSKVKKVMTLHDFWIVCPKNTLLRKDASLCNDILKCLGCDVRIKASFIPVPLWLRHKVVSGVLKGVDHINSPSKSLKNIVEGFTDLKIEHIPNGLMIDDYMRIQREEQDTQNVLMLGAILPHKGAYVLLDAFRKIHLLDNSLRLTLAGVTSEWDRIKNYMRANRLEDVVEMVGWFNSEKKKLQLLEKADVFVQPSIWYENNPLTVIEAMASGLPVVGSGIGGIPEMVENGRTGFLSKAGDSRELGEKILRLAQDRRLRESLGRAGREKAEKTYDIRKHASKIMKVYESL